ncbi:MAG: PleD family two-component system response regulator [Candidatus Hermodarchaeota archaeon]
MTDIKKTTEMKKYEKETGKQAIWHGSITESFKRWQEEKEVYGIGKKGIGILIDNDKKKEWKKHAKENELTLTKFIIKAVEFYIDNKINRDIKADIKRISHNLKESLTVIQGFSSLIIENESENLTKSVLSKVNEIYTHSLSLENKIDDLFVDIKLKHSDYDILIVEDDTTTITILNDLFESKGYSSKGILTGMEAIRELKRVVPKVILLDIILPDIDGFEVCEKIKSDEQLKNIPLYYITAIQESEVIEYLNKTGADGYFLKPFKFSQFEEIFKLL